MDLVVLAAGMGSRFGGLKQIQPIDEDNNFIIDYSIYDAIKAGFDRIIFIIKEENYEIFKETIGNRLGNNIDVKYVFQKLDNVPSNLEIPKDRIKPWGTAHAIYCAKDVVSNRFAIINADDFYGYETFKLVADFLKNNKDDEFANVGFYVKNTLSDKGAVKRGVFTVENGFATNLVESEVEKRDNKVFATPLGENDWKQISENTLVSMNIFGFTKNLIQRLNNDFLAFFKQENLSKAEFLIPTVVNDMMQDNSVTVKVLTTPEKWYGITYKEDLEEFKIAISNMKKQGVYPMHLY
ncbi:MAG: nucleotidyltransferase [Clostridia bacterium]|nr:nucleotidyltransferase [Clostridia bacterium]